MYALILQEITFLPHYECLKNFLVRIRRELCLILLKGANKAKCESKVWRLTESGLIAVR